MKNPFYYADCYDKMAKKEIAVYGVCTGKIRTAKNGENYVCVDCVKCPYWVYAGAKKET